MAETERRFHPADLHDIEVRAGSDLERLPGVISAAVWLDSNAHLRLARLHIMPGVAATIVCNAAARVLQVGGVPFDPRDIRTINVALPDEVHQHVLTAALPSRYLLLQDIGIIRSGHHVTCRVQLMRGENFAAGEARELDTPAGRARAAAAATLRAAEVSTENLALGLEAAILTQMFGRSYAAVAVEASIGRRVATLAAIAAMDDSRAPEESFCLAALRAIDRWIGG
jgi:hypothetical protein